jgi:uncharacterized iron-regulated protein
MRIPWLTQALLLVLLILTVTGCSITQVMRIENREVIDVKTMLDELRATPLIFMGERHDQASHHKLQLDVIKALQAEGKPLAIGMEMFEGSSQPALDAWSAGKVPEYAIRSVFMANWRNLSFELYRDIIIYARDNKIPIVALNAPRAIVETVARNGFASLADYQLAQLPAGVKGEVSEEFQQFMISAYPMHGRSGDSFRNICEAQMLRNRVMAKRIMEYFHGHPDGSMVVLAGGAHARERGGIPAELSQLSYKIVLPTVEALTPQRVTKGDGDYLFEDPSLLP